MKRAVGRSCIVGGGDEAIVDNFDLSSVLVVVDGRGEVDLTERDR